MQKVVLRFAFLVLPIAAAVWAGCTAEQAADSTPELEAGAETAPPDVYVPNDAAPDAPKGRDCTADLDADGVPKHLDCTGLYADAASKTVRPENKAYTPGFTFWSDGAEKSRWVYLAPGAKIDISSFDEWKFPNGTKLWKEFRLGTKRIETRLYYKEKDSWRHTTYRWNDAETEAVRKDNGERVTVAGKADYEVPSTDQCNLCHIGRAEPVLGFDAVSLGVATAQGVTLATLAAEGRFATTPPATSITVPNDHDGKAAPAIGWMHANCGSCHNANPNAGAQFTQLFLLLRPSRLLPEAGTALVRDLDSYKTTVNVQSTRPNFDAGANYVRIVPKDPASSILSILAGRRATGAMDPSADIQMPPVVTRAPDTQGVALLDAWINALP
jgi:hypothetical protein